MGSSMSGLEQRSYIVTGAGGSIGRAAALILARRGANVVVADIVEAAAEETVRLIRAEGGNAVYSHCDVSIEDNAWSTVELAITEFGRLDGAFNNAGLPPVNVPLHQLTSADFQRSLDINVLGVFHCMKHQIAAMLKAGSGGSIVNTASVGGTVAIPAHGEYIAAKHAVIGLTRIAAVDYGQQGIRVNRSEEHTSELQSLMRTSYAAFCYKKKNRAKGHKQQYRERKNRKIKRQHSKLMRITYAVF